MKTRGRLVFVAVIALALIGAALLVLRSTASGGQTALEADTARHTVRLVVEPPVAGTSSVQVEVDGSAAVRAVGLEPVMTHMGHAGAPVAAEPVPGEAAGRYRADVRMDMPGQWS